MITQNDLYDISYIFTLLRDDIQCNYNKSVVCQIINVLEDKQTISENQIRRALSNISKLNKEKWSFVFHENVYVNHKILHDQSIYNLLIKICQELLESFETNNFEKAYDLVDAFHSIPNILADNCFSIPKSFWKNNTKYYSRKWGIDFLKE